MRSSSRAASIRWLPGIEVIGGFAAQPTVYVLNDPALFRIVRGTEVVDSGASQQLVMRHFGFSRT
jgi:hypothetical protein